MALIALILVLLMMLAFVVFFWLYVNMVFNVDSRLNDLEDTNALIIDRMEVIERYIQTPDA